MAYPRRNDPVYEPTQDEIQQATDEIRSHWSTEERLRRIEGMTRDPQPTRIFHVRQGHASREDD